MKPRPETDATAGRFAYEGLDRLFHEKARLSIVSSLAANTDGLAFNDLKELCALTDGNLSRHLTLLQEASIVEIIKGFQGNRPQTMVHLTPTGRKRFAAYVATLEEVVTDALRATQRTPATRPQSPIVGDLAT